LVTEVKIRDKVLDHPVHRGFVRFTIQSTGGGVEKGQRLYVFDHRPATLGVAKAIWNGQRAKLEGKKELQTVVSHPAKIVVMEKVVGEDRVYPYINLFPANGQEPTALLSETLYVGKHNACFKIRENNGLWSWTSESFSRTGRHQEMVLVALTDDDHRIIVDSYGYVNIGHSDEHLTMIDAEIRRSAPA